MPKSKMQAEFTKATKIDADDYESRQEYLVAVVEKVNTFKDPQWDKLSEEAQDWINAAVKKLKAKKRVEDFPDVGSVPKDEDDDEPKKGKKKGKSKSDDDEDEDDEPKKKKKKAADEEDDEDEESEDDEASEDEDEDEDESEDEDDDEEEEPPKKKKKKPADDDDDEDKPAKKKKKKPADEDDDEDEDDEEDEKPKKKKGKSKSKSDDDDDDDDDEDDKPAKKKKPGKVENKPSGVKVAIKTAIIENPEITVDQLIKKLGKGGAPVSKVTVSNVRAEFRHTLRVLKELGKLKGVDF